MKKNDFERKLYPLAKKINLHPNTITCLSIFFTAIGAYLVIIGYVLVGLFLMAIGSFCDVLDGTVAKAQKKRTKFGSLFDKLADRINDFIMMFAPVYSGFVDATIGFVAIGLVLIGSYLSALLDSHTENKKTGNKLSMRAIRTIILLGGGVLVATYTTAWEISFYIIIVIAAYSLLERLNYAFNRV